MNWLANVLPILLDSALKGSLVVALAAGAAWFLRRNSAATRHSVWSAAIAAQLLIPVLVFLLPTWRVPLVDEPVWVVPSAPTAALTATPTVPSSAAPALDADKITAPSNAIVDKPASATPPASSADQGSTSSEPSAALSPIAILAAIWLLGCIAVLVRLAVGTISVSRLARKGERVIDEQWLGLLHRLAVSLCITRPLTLLRGDALAVPVTWGIVYPVVLLPQGADQWPEERRRYVLVHEMAHVKRFDAFTQLLSQFVLAVFWFNPLAWVAAARMRRERENACDDYVLSHGTKPSMYASDLLELVQAIDTDGHRAAAPAFAALAMARRSEFEGRMLSILDHRLRRNSLTRKGALMGLLATLLVAAPLAAFTPYTPASAMSAAPAGDTPESFVSLSDARPASGAGSGAASGTAMNSASLAISISADMACDRVPTTKSTSTNIHDSDKHPDERTIRMVQRVPGRCVEVAMMGVITFTADERDIASLGRGASARFRELKAGSEREIAITGEGSQQDREYRVNGREAAFDAGGRDWLASMILTAIRESAFDAPARVTRLARQGGANRVLTEIDAIQSSGAKRAYYGALLEVGAPFSDSTLTRVLTHMDRQFQGSSGDFRSVLAKVPARSVRSQESRMAFIATIRRIDSDGDKAEMLGELLPTADRALLLAVMDVAITIGSDGDKSDLLVSATAAYLAPKDQQLRDAYFRVAETVQSDGDLSNVLLTAVPLAHADPEITAAVIRTSRRIDSDGDKADVLTAVARQRLLTTKPLKDAFMEVAQTIGSDGDRARVLRAALLD